MPILDDGNCQYTILTLNLNENIGGTIFINVLKTSISLLQIYYRGLTNIEAISNYGYEFDHWEIVNGTLENENNPSISIFIDEDVSITAYFSPVQFDITFDVSHTDGGIISINDSILNDLPQTLSLTYGETYNIRY